MTYHNSHLAALPWETSMSEKPH